MSLFCLFVRPSVSTCALLISLAQCLEKYFTKLTPMLHNGTDRDERVTFWGQEIKRRGH